jgi:hypothetical protein
VSPRGPEGRRDRPARTWVVPVVVAIAVAVLVAVAVIAIASGQRFF